MSKILQVEDLYVSFDTYAGEIHAVRGVSFSVEKSEVLAIVGESGSGKSVTSQTIMRLNPSPPARIKSGSINLLGNDIVSATEKEMQSIRGRDVSMIFQDPMTSLNPTMKVGKQIAEAILAHNSSYNKKTAMEKAIELLNVVQIPNARERANQYPHQFSGGMRQRAMIAMALSCDPALLIADEPTTALDVTIQAQIMALLSDIKEQRGTAIMLITHDLGVVANLADSVAVMYAGKIVEYGTVDEIFKSPKHPYTIALLKSLPKVDSPRDAELSAIAGTPPDLFAPPAGCEFASRCEVCMRMCKENVPDRYDISDTHYARCFRLHEDFKKYHSEEVV